MAVSPVGLFKVKSGANKKATRDGWLLIPGNCFYGFKSTIFGNFGDFGNRSPGALLPPGNEGGKSKGSQKEIGLVPTDIGEKARNKAKGQRLIAKG